MNAFCGWRTKGDYLMKRMLNSNSYVKSSNIPWINILTPTEVEDISNKFHNMDNEELLNYFTKYAIKCNGFQIEAPDERTGDIFGLVENELRSRLGI